MNIPKIKPRSACASGQACAWLAVLLSTAAGIASAASLTFSVGSTNGLTNSMVVVPVRVSHFTNISSFQFSMHWKTNVAAFVGVEQFGLNGLATNNDSFGTTLVSTGTLTVLWIDPDGATTTVTNDGTMIFGVRFHLIGPAATNTPVTIDRFPTDLVAGDENGAAITNLTTVNGLISIDRTLVVQCAADKTVECGSVWNFDPPVPTDSCGGLPVTTNILSTTTNFGTCGFTATRTWELLDACTNRFICVQTVTGIDTTPPVPNCPGNKTVECGSAWNFDLPTATDTCSSLVTSNIVSTVTNVTGACGAIATRTWEFFDSCGNRSTCSQAVTITDTTPPQLVPAPAKIVECGPGWAFDDPTVSDNCIYGTNIVPRAFSTVTNTPGTCGYTVTRTWEAFDACNNRSTCSQVVTVIDTTKPVVSCTADKIAECGSAWHFDEPTATDNCVSTNLLPRIFSTSTNATGNCGYAVTRVWEFVDPCGNRATCQQIVTLIDTTPPTVTNATSKMVECGSAWNFDIPVATDNCSSGTNLITSVFSTATNTAVTCPFAFMATRIWQIVDACGNSSMSTQTVTAVDTTPPEIACVGNKFVESGATWDFDIPTAADRCTGTNVTSRIVSTITNAGPCIPTFTATRTWEFADGCGNKTNCMQTVIVRDMTPPVFTFCPANKTVNCLAPWSFDTPSATDVGSGVITNFLITTTTNGSCGNGFTATRTWRATDNCGNSSTCSQIVSGRAIVSVSGAIYNPTNYPPTSGKVVVGAMVLGPTNTSGMTTVDGSYTCVFDAANNVSITPLGPTNGNPADGVTTLDISLVRRHILNSSLLDSPYKVLAADVDGSGSVSTLDLSFMRRLVLGTTNRFPIGLWRFAPADASFADILHPFTVPTSRTYPSVSSDLAGQDFVAVKLGDVNGSWAPPANGLTAQAAKDVPNNLVNPVTFTAGTGSALPGNDVVIPIQVSDFTNIVGFQFSFHWNTNIVKFVSLQPSALTFSATMYDTSRSNSGTVTVAWTDESCGTCSSTLSNGTPVLFLRFTCIGSPSNSTSLFFDDSPTGREVDGLDTDGNPVVVASSFLSGQITVDQPNRAPVVSTIGNKVVNEGTLLSFTVTASDPDGSIQTQSFSLDPGAPTGANIDPVTGVFTWTPSEAQGPGFYSITVRATDNGSPSLSGTNIFNVTVNEVNAPPVAIADSYSVNEDATLTVTLANSVLNNDSDSDGDPIKAFTDTLPTHGSLAFSTNGAFIYTPVANYHGPDSFTYHANDGQADSASVTVSITVNSINDAPLANNDNYLVNEDTTLTVNAAAGVLSNDTDVDLDTLSVVLGSVTTPAHGSLTLNSDGSFTYRPATNYFGSDSFTYRATDGQATSALATVTITINPINDAPIAVADSYTLNEDTVLNVAAPGVLGNDTDVDGSLTAIQVTPPTHGALTLNTNGSFTYTPVTNYNGPDAFSYAVTDGSLTSATVVVSLTINPTNDVPVAGNDNYITDEDTPLTVNAANGILANDTDVDSGDVLTVVLAAGPQHGVLSLNTNNGSFTYTPNTNYNGTDSFTYRANDGKTSSAPATVTITINSVNDVPVANADSYSVNEDSPLVVSAPGVLGNDTDADGNPLTAVLDTGTTHGTLTLNSNGSFSYMPSANFNGTDSFTYRASDGQASSPLVTVTITVNAVNDTPSALDDGPYVTAEDTALNVPATSGVLTNDSDIEASALTAILVNTTTNGSLTLSNNGGFLYVPNANFHGVDHFSYRASDGSATSSVAIVTINITSVNDVPVVQNDSYTINEDATLTVNVPGVLANDSDADGDALVVTLVTNTTHGTLTLNANGSFTYMPAGNFHGADAFAYRANDGFSTSAVAIVSLVVATVNDVPVANNDSYNTDEDAALVINAPGVLSNDTDADGDPLSAVLINAPTHGALTLNADGSFTYTPTHNYYGSDSFSYRANDGTANSALATVSLTINSVNDAPVLAPIGNKFVTAGELLSFTATATDVDVPAQLLTFTAEGAPSGASIDSSTGVFTWTPNDTQSPSTNTVTIRVTDNGTPAQNSAETFVIIVGEYFPPAISISDITVPGGTDGTLEALFEVTLSAPSLRTVFVDFATADGSALAGSDYTATNGTLVFAPGVTNLVIDVPAVGKSTVYTNRVFSVNLSNAVNATIADTEGIGTLDSNPAPGLYIDDVSVVEGARGGLVTAVFTVSLIGEHDQLVTVSYAGVKGTALARKDFKPKKGKLKFPPGTTTQTIVVPIVGESLSEYDETFTVNLSKSVNAVIVRGQGTGTILDDDPLPGISIADITAVEANSGARAISFIARLSAKSGRPVSIDFSTADGTALAGSDYIPTNGTVVFPPGLLLRKIVVPVLGNKMSENAETFSLNFANPVNATLANAQATANIRDTDADPVVSAGDATVVPNGPGASAQFTLQLSAPSEKLITIHFATAQGTATANTDYFPVTDGVVDFQPGTTSVVVNVDLVGNSDAAGRTFFLDVLSAANAKIGDRVGTCTIPTP